MKTSPCRYTRFISEETDKEYTDSRVNTSHQSARMHTHTHTHTHTHMLLARIYSEANARKIGGRFRYKQGEIRKLFKGYDLGVREDSSRICL